MEERTTHKEKTEVMKMVIDDLEVGAIATEGFYPISLKTSRGTLEGRYYAAAERQRAVIFVGDWQGGWDTPVRNMLFPGLANYFARHGINCLRIKYRHPGKLSESILDILAGISFLNHDGIQSIGLVGHGFGATAIIHAGAASSLVSTLVSIAPQYTGTETIDSLRDSQSVLFIHDSPLSGKTVQPIHEYSHEPKKIIFYKGANHNFDEAGPEVFLTIKDWITRYVQ